MNTDANEQADHYFSALDGGLAGLQTYMNDAASGSRQHDVIAAIVAEYVERLDGSLESWRTKLAFENKFRVSHTESGFPAFENVLDLKNARKTADEKLSGFEDPDAIREKMVDVILSERKVPLKLQRQMAERAYLESLSDDMHFDPLVLPKTIRVSVNPKTRRPYYVVHWGYYDGVSNLPLIYILTVEDSSPDVVKLLVGPNGKLNKTVNISLPVGGLLNPELALKFDEFCDKNSAYSYTLSTIATNLDHDFNHLHPKQLRRIVMGPFYHSAFTRHGEKVQTILARVNKHENAWLMTWTLQEIFSVNENPAKNGLWSSQPAREEFHINTDDLECVQQGVSAFQRHVLVPHEAYQAIYASGQEDEIFGGYNRHVISDGHVLRNL